MAPTRKVVSQVSFCVGNPNTEPEPNPNSHPDPNPNSKNELRAR